MFGSMGKSGTSRVPQAEEAGMTTRDRPGNGWTVVLRRHPVRTTSTARWPMLA